jgi:hypothetical protein
MLVVAVAQHGQVVAALAVQVVVVQVVAVAQPYLELQILVAVVGLLDMVQVHQAQAAQALSLFPTQAHKEAQAAQSHQAVATPFTHSLHQALIQLNF